MKKLAYLIIAILTISLTFTSCEKDDPTPDSIPQTASGATVTPTDDTLTFYAITSNSGTVEFLINDNIAWSDIHTATITPNGTDRFSASIEQLDMDGNGTIDYSGRAYGRQVDMFDPNYGLVFADTYTIRVILTSGYSYETTLVIRQIEL